MISAGLPLPNPAATAKLGAALSQRLRIGDVVALRGALGMGKTTLARSIIQARLGQPIEVVSPSFTLVQTYEAGDLTIWHFDLYRLASCQEIEELGWEEALCEGVAVVEWPERAGSRLPPERLAIELLPAAQPEARLARISGLSERWHSCLDHIKQVMNEPIG